MADCITFYVVFVNDITLWCLNDTPLPRPNNFSKFFQPGNSYSNPPDTGYYILGEIPSNTIFQDIYSFCIDENKKNLLENQKILLNLGEFSSPTPDLFQLPPPLLGFGDFSRPPAYSTPLLLGTKEYGSIHICRVLAPYYHKDFVLCNKASSLLRSGK